MGLVDQSMITWRALEEQTELFSAELTKALSRLGIQEECRRLEMDHICVRMKEAADVDRLRRELSEVGQVISAVNVNGREILIIQLEQPIVVGDWKTYGIELPYPKATHNYQDGWEHVEFVLEGADNTMSGVREAFLNKFPHVEKELLTDTYSYVEDEPQADGDQLPNPTIGLKVNGIGIKFHANPIQRVVGYEG